MNKIKEYLLQKLENYNFCDEIQVFELFGIYMNLETKEKIL
ncbi:MAG: hypothetical protein ACK5HR_03315 [Mycoplasmatales bacterium]